MTTEKAFTIQNPFAYLICIGAKPVENRTWKTNFRGKVLIHSAAKWYPGSSRMVAGLRVQYPKGILSEAQIEQLGGDYEAAKLFNTMPLSSIIGEVEIVDCVQNHPSPWAIPGYWHWVLENPVMFTHYVPNVKGRLSFWNVGDGVQELVIDEYFRTGKH